MLIKVDGRDLNIRFSAAHFIPSHDKCSRLHGHDYTVSAEIEGKERNGFVVDYLIVEKYLREITEPMDHRLLIPKGGRDMLIGKEGEYTTVEYMGKRITLKTEDAFFLDADSSSSEDISSYLLNRLVKMLKPFENVRNVTLCVYEGPGRGACARQ